ncbi:MAG: hypothetical protein NT035_01320 [Burkholderiales bacterium]|nr:hypothetical protein [Burkholderiales bacterium]
MSNFIKDDGTGMTPPPAAGSASGAVTSRDATRRHPNQGVKPRMKIDINSHGIRRETSLDPKPKKTRPKKV